MKGLFQHGEIFVGGFQHVMVYSCMHVNFSCCSIPQVIDIHTLISSRSGIEKYRSYPVCCNSWNTGLQIGRYGFKFPLCHEAHWWPWTSHYVLNELTSQVAVRKGHVYYSFNFLDKGQINKILPPQIIFFFCPVKYHSEYISEMLPWCKWKSFLF